MTPELEKMARAICAQMMKLQPDDVAVGIFWGEWVDCARAGLLAIRDAGDTVIAACGGPPTSAGWGEPFVSDAIRRDWAKAIDAILGEPPKKECGDAR